MPEPRRERERSEPQTEIARGEDQLIPALLTSVVEEICAAMSASGAVITGLDAQGVRCLASAGDAPSVGSRIQLNGGLTLECLKTGQFVLGEDAESDSGAPPPMDGSLAVRSVVAVPILAQGSVVGTIEVFSSGPSATYASDIASLEGMADFLAPLLAPASVYAAPPITADSTIPSIQAETPSPAEEQ
jgi:GAF domain-containing protein